MILGVFTGTTVAALERDIAKLDRLRLKFKDRHQQAVADRVTAIAEMKQELDQLAALTGRY